MTLREQLKILRVVWRMILKWFLENWGGGGCIGFIWPTLETSIGFYVLGSELVCFAKYSCCVLEEFPIPLSFMFAVSNVTVIVTCDWHGTDSTLTVIVTCDWHGTDSTLTVIVTCDWHGTDSTSTAWPFLLTYPMNSVWWPIKVNLQYNANG